MIHDPEFNKLRICGTRRTDLSTRAPPKVTAKSYQKLTLFVWTFGCDNVAFQSKNMGEN